MRRGLKTNQAMLAATKHKQTNFLQHFVNILCVPLRIPCASLLAFLFRVSTEHASSF